MNINKITTLGTESAIQLHADAAPLSSVIIVTSEAVDNTSAILGACYQVTTCSSLRDFADLVQRSRDLPPDLVLVCESLLDEDPQLLQRVKRRMRRHTPLLVLSRTTHMSFAARYAESGARDVVSTDHPQHMRFAIKREIQDYRVRCAYRRYVSHVSSKRPKPGCLTVSGKNAESRSADNSDSETGRIRLLEKMSERLGQKLQRGVRVLAWIRPDQFSAVEKAIGVLGSEDALDYINSSLQKLRHPSDLCGRFGGTVFVALIERGTMDEAVAWVQSLNRVLNERPFVSGRRRACLTCTTGICEIANGISSAEQALVEAHDACRRGRVYGGGQIFLSASSKPAQSVRLQDKKWAKRLQHAVKKNRFYLIHTPVVRLDGCKEKIRDCWVRMIDESGNTILPGEFLPFAKRLALTSLVERWIIAANLTYCIKRKPDLVFVRLSSSTILDASLIPWLQRLFADSSVKPSQICFQVTAAVAASHMTHVVRQAKVLSGMGFKFAVEKISDSPKLKNVLRLVPMHYARIDPALSHRVARDRSVQHRVSKIVADIRARGIFAVADQVEDAATMANLCRIEVELIQGDYLRRDNIVMEDTSTMCTPLLPAANPA